MTEHLLFIPARAGNGKNLWELDNIPLWKWSYNLAIEANFGDIIISTDIKNFVRNNVPIYMRRPSVDSEPIHKAVLDYLNICKKQYDWVWLLQPTSPFLTQRTLGQAFEIIESKEGASINSIQTIISVEHNNHWLNQRRVTGKQVSFIYNYLRMRAYNKQKKQTTYKFGNLIVARPGNIKSQETMFCWPSHALLLENRYEAHDVDTKEDLELARMFLDRCRKAEKEE